MIITTNKMKEKELFTTVKPEICLGLLFQSRDIVHLTHLATVGYAEHKALNELYDGLLDLTDDLCETYFGTIGKRLNIKIPASEYMNARTHCIFMKDYIMKHRGVFGAENTHIQNILDEVLALYTKTLYLLTLT
jgi:hypothetical protein